MKHLVKITLGVLIWIFSFSQRTEAQNQFGEDDALYLSTDLWMGNYWGYGIGVNYLQHDKFSVQVGWSRHNIRSQNTPDDYFSGGLFSYAGPHDEVRGIEFLGGKAFELTKYKRVRLNLLGGIALSKFKEPTNWTRIEYNSFREAIFRPNYSYTYSSSNQVFFVIQPKLEIPFSRTLGFSISGRVATNGNTHSYELGVGLIIGMLRDRIYPQDR